MYRIVFREFIAPLVSKMDAEGELDKGLLKELFNAGLMGIEIPAEYGGNGMTFFQGRSCDAAHSYACC